MMVKVNDDYLEFDGEIDVSRQAKLFEDIDKASGDFSYDIEIPDTSHNKKLLGIYSADNKDKSVYQKIDAIVLNNFGEAVYYGYIRVERFITASKSIRISFFSGNNNWFERLTGNLDEIDFSSHDELLTYTNIIGSWPRSEGLKYSILDSGELKKRKRYIFSIFDFIPEFFVKTIFIECFASSGLKLDGELIDDTMYNRLTITLANTDDIEITNRSAYALKNVEQGMPPPSGPAYDPAGVISFDDVTTDPYYTDNEGNFSLSGRYTADVPMILKISVKTNDNSVKYSGFSEFVGISIVFNDTDSVPLNPGNTILVDNHNYLATTSIYLGIGDFITLNGFRSPGSPSDQTLNNITVEFTPLVLYKTFINSSLPKWTKRQFVLEVIKIFNVIPSFDTFSKTVTLNLFDNIKAKEQIDISEYVSNIETDFIEVVSNYAQDSKFVYESPSIDEIEKYNDNNNDGSTYNSGSILVDNFYIEKVKEILTSAFSTPFSYKNLIFDIQLEKVNIRDYIELFSLSVDHVNGLSGGIAGFEVGNQTGFKVGDLVRISESTEPSYNGDWIIESYLGDDTLIMYGDMPFITSANYKIAKIIPGATNASDTFLLADTGPLPMSYFTGATDFVISYPDGISTTTGELPSISFFNMPNTGKAISDIFRYGLSFDRTSYQVSIIDRYFMLMEGILNDPVKIICECNLPLNVFRKIDFLRPIFIKSEQTSNLYYPNKITGYRDRIMSCIIELIKL